MDELLGQYRRRFGSDRYCLVCNKLWQMCIRDRSFFFAGYALMQVPGGMLAEKFGHRFTGSIACGWWSVFTALTLSLIHI